MSHRIFRFFSSVTLLVVMISLLTGCIFQSTPTPNLESPPMELKITPAPGATRFPEPTLINTPLTSSTMTMPAPTPPEPTPQAVLSGGVVQDGPFTFYIWIYQDPSLNQNPVTTSLYSDLNGYGAYLFWVYQEAEQPGPIAEWYGTEPHLQKSNSYASLKDHARGGRSGGMMLPGGFFIEGQSNPGDQVKQVIKLVVRDQVYGAAITFTLQPGPNGWQPEGIGEPFVLDKDQVFETSATEQASVMLTPEESVISWSALYGAEDPERAAWLEFVGRIEGNSKGNYRLVRFYYPDEWLITDMNTQHIAVQNISLSSGHPPSEPWAKLEIVYLKTPPILEGEISRERIHTVTIASVSGVLIEQQDMLTVIFMKDGVWYSVAGYMNGGDQTQMKAFRSILLQMMASLEFI